MALSMTRYIGNKEYVPTISGDVVELFTSMWEDKVTTENMAKKLKKAGIIWKGKTTVREINGPDVSIMAKRLHLQCRAKRVGKRMKSQDQKEAQSQIDALMRLFQSKGLRACEKIGFAKTMLAV